jgi:hypothetical protein
MGMTMLRGIGELRAKSKGLRVESQITKGRQLRAKSKGLGAESGERGV